MQINNDAGFTSYADQQRRWRDEPRSVDLEGVDEPRSVELEGVDEPRSVELEGEGMKYLAIKPAFVNWTQGHVV